MSNKLLIPRGTADILPEEIPLWQKVESTARQLFRNYGFQEIRTPIFEETALFKRSLGSTSDVVNKQLLELKKQLQEDGQGDSSTEYALRPEGTASIVRSYIENSLDKKQGISKLFYIGPMFRGERPQKGRLRQFHQIGVEVMGPQTAHPFLDAEVISLAINLFKKLGWENPKLLINSLGTPEDKKNFSVLLRSKLEKKRSELCEECQSRLDRNIFRILDCKNKTCQNIVKQLQIDDSHLSKDSQQYYTKVKAALKDLGVSFEESFQLVRGLDYYTHTVFEIVDSTLGSQNALGAGGRYNNLVSDLGGPQIDAIGFALGIERILLALKEDQRTRAESINAFIVPLDEPAMQWAFKILNQLRLLDVAADMSYKLASVKSQMRLADKSSASYVIIIGEEELKSKSVTLKDMKSGEQQKVSVTGSNLDALIKRIKG